MGKLSATRVSAIKLPGRYTDEDGLMLVVGKGGARSWMLRVKEPGPFGKRRDIGIGSAGAVTLMEARERAKVLRGQVKNGEQPKAWWRKVDDPTPTFREAASRLHTDIKAGWKNGKHQAQWLSTLETHAFPRIGDMPVDLIGSSEISAILLPIWLTVPETARRVRQRVGSVLDWAHAKGYRATEAPIRSVNKTLPKQAAKTGHFTALPFQDVSALVARLREGSSMGRAAVEAVILTAARSGEVRGARWSEVDLEAALWTIPAPRMKAGKAHEILLSEPAVRLFRRLAEMRRGELVFPGSDARKPLSDMTLTKVLRDMAVPATVHGFRSTFRDWVAEETSFPDAVAEAALAHQVSDKTIAAYKRTTFKAKRREMMDAWGAFVDGKPADVISLADARSRAAGAAAA